MKLVVIEDNTNTKHSTQRKKSHNLHKTKSVSALSESTNQLQALYTQNSKILDIISKISAILVAIYSILKYMYSHFYSQQCEKFYHIPARYFSKSINNSILYIVLLIVLLAVPFLIKRFAITENNGASGVVMYVLLSLYYSFSWCIIILLCLFQICNNNNSTFVQLFSGWFAEHLWLSGIIIMFFSTIATMLLPIISSIIKKLKSNILKNAICITFSAIISANLLILSVGSHYVLNSNPASNTVYEIANCKGQKYAVLSEYNDKLLVVPIDIAEDNIAVLNTTWYNFIDVRECKLSTITFESVPQIEHENTE